MEFRKSTPADIDEMMQIVNDAKLLQKTKYQSVADGIPQPAIAGKRHCRRNWLRIM